MESLTGDDLQRAKDSDEEGKHKYEETKNRILTQQKEFLRRWTGV
jgi:hypothetical protein